MTIGNLTLIGLCLGGFVAVDANAQEPTIPELLNSVGLKSVGEQRGQMDVVGIASTAEQMDRVSAQCQQLAQARQAFVTQEYHLPQDSGLSAGVCPHDDYYYAGRLYELLLSRVHAKRVIIFGVFHKARVFQCHDRLVFDAFRTWHGPYGSVPVAGLREEILQRLPDEDYLVSNDMQMVEHSVEAIIPFLQAHNREVEIISILVPYMDWKTLDHLASDLASALVSLLREKNWRLGQDLSFLCSADAVHYGDAGWGGKNYAPFGTDVEGYRQAVNRDLELANSLLCGTVTNEKLEQFLYRCTDPQDVTQYRITWCGRFSIPFGLNVAGQVAKALEGRHLEGRLLDYGTSVSEASLATEGLDRVGPTAPNNLHHFVGYAAIGYW